ncbi:pectate lyase-like protein [Spirosoma oryzae]|uniref:Pectate lyase-like protein n=1 Tax=Spirosoma oryzae TaxID=1469603 RepID=A0A2T0SYI7_9BACT|nr:glycosyl hydrolase family 28-related protein [Spirosoma oryzae]PRY38476.1 pectate lyase-like protein [Spirosoma oryzae]
MAKTQFTGTQLGPGTITRTHLNVTQPGSALLTRLTSSAGLSQTSTGIDSGTGDVSLVLIQPTFATVTELTAYTGTQTQLLLADGRSYTYNSSSSLTTDNYYVVAATGKGSGRYLLNNTGANTATLTVATCRAMTAPAGLAPSVISLGDSIIGGLFRYDSADTSTADDGAMTLVTSTGLRYKRIVDGFVNVRWFNAKGDGTTDDAPAINAAINYAVAQIGVYKLKTVFIPEGNYLCNSSINCSNRSGLTLTGATGRTQNTVLIGNSGTIAVDFSGSSESTLANLSLSIYNGLSNPALVGLQFALSKDSTSQATAGNQKGGLNCSVSNVSIKGGDFVSINGGLGFIGLINCRSEEFCLHNVTIQANTPVLFTTTNTIQATTGYNYTITSPNAGTYIQDNNSGSMGVVNWSGQNSLYSWEYQTPTQLLNGVNSYNFHGYMTRLNNTQNGTYQAAVRVCQPTYGLKLQGTVEGSSTLLAIQNTLVNPDINLVSANVTSTSSPLLTIDNYGGIQGGRIGISFGNPGTELGTGRWLMTTPVINSGNSPTNAFLSNVTFDVPQWTDMGKVVMGNLLKNTQNTRFNVATPIEKMGPAIRSTYNVKKGLGVTPGGNGTVTGVIAQFTSAAKTDTTTGNGGYYSFYVNGTVSLGDYNTNNGIAMYRVEGYLSVAQNVNGAMVPVSSEISVHTASSLNGNYLQIASVSISLDMSATPYPVLKMSVNTSGSGTGEAVNFYGRVEIMNDHLVNQALLLS